MTELVSELALQGHLNNHDVDDYCIAEYPASIDSKGWISARDGATIPAGGGHLTACGRHA